MKRRLPQNSGVMGVHAPAPRLTLTAACLIALGLSVPVFAILSVLQWALLG